MLTQLRFTCSKQTTETLGKSVKYVNPAKIYLFKANNGNTRKKCKICSKLTVKTRQWRRSGVFIVNFEHILHLFLVFFFVDF